MTWRWTQRHCCDRSIPRALGLTLADSLQGVEMTPNTQDGSFLLHLNKLTFSTQCFPDFQHAYQSNPGSEGNMHLVFAKLLASPLLPLLILTLLVIWEIWTAGIFFHQARYWSLHPQLSKKHGQRNKKVVLCCTMLGSHPWAVLRSALMPSFQEEGALKSSSKLTGRCMSKTANSQRWSIDTTERSFGWTVSH